jgi:hypothetical protein
MDNNEILDILNEGVFLKEKAYLLEKVSEQPERFVGKFRSTTPELKLMQYVLQSREIRFGDALEKIVRKFIASMDFTNLSTKLNDEESKKKERLELDQFFQSNATGTYYLWSNDLAMTQYRRSILG